VNRGAEARRRWWWTRTRRRLATAPRLPLTAAIALGLAALLELAARTTVASSAHAAPVGIMPKPTLVSVQTLEIGNTVVSAQDAMVVCALALAAILTPAFLPPATAALFASTANLVSIGLFHTVTVTAAAAQVLVLHRLGLAGSRLLAPALGLPFLGFALAAANPPGSETGVLTVLLTALAPAAALGGLARRSRTETLAHSAAQEAIASTLLEHTARGERARIARELHDVVAHHISMIAVQAETARLATPGMPDTGARRLLEIGDTARAALTEMRRLLGVLREDARDTAEVGRPAPAPTAIMALGQACQVRTLLWMQAIRAPSATDSAPAATRGLLVLKPLVGLGLLTSRCVRAMPFV